MTTLATMKAEIADELARADLTGIIATSITEAIKFYQSTRFSFHTVTGDDFYFTTVANQEFYDRYDHHMIDNIREIDCVVLEVGTSSWTMHPVKMEFFETLISAATGEPSSYNYSNNRFRLYPVPLDSSHTIRVTAHVDRDGPATDDETCNPWMNEASLLIKSRALVNVMRKINLSKIGDPYSKQDLLMYREMELEALQDLKGSSNMQDSTMGRVESY